MYDGIELEEMWGPDDHETLVEMFDEFNEEELDVEKQVNLFREYVERVDTKSMLEKLTLGLYISGFGASLPIPDDGVGIAPRLTEYVIGVLIDTDNIDDNEVSYQEIAKRSQQVANAYLYSDLKDSDPEELSEEERIEERIRFDLRAREVTASRFSYWNQPLIAARKRYEPHDEILLEEVGFTIEDAITYLLYIEYELNERVIDIFEEIFSSDIDIFADQNTRESLQTEVEETGNLPRPTERKDFNRDVDSLKEIFNDIDPDLNQLWFSYDSLVNGLPDEFSEERFRKFLDRMTVEAGNWNHPIDEEFKHIDQFNPFHSHPIVELDDELIIPHPDVFRRSLMETFYYDLINSDEYEEDDFGNIWGDYLEEWTHEQLDNLFDKVKDDSEVLLNPMYKDGKLEKEAADVIIIHNKTIFAVECKTKPLTVDTRSGDYNTAMSDLEDGIGSAAKQATDIIEKIKSGEVTTLQTDHGEIELDNNKYSFYFPLVVVGEQYDSFSTILFDQAIDEDDRTPFVVDILMLQVITEVFPSVLPFITYVSKRRSQVHDKVILSMDELDYLGLFLEMGRDFPSIPENTFLFIGDMSHVVGQKINYKFGP